MPFIAKLGDVTADGGIIVGPGWPNVTLNGIPLAKIADSIAPHACCGAPGCEIHCVSKVQAQRMIGRITVNGLPMVVAGDIPTCGIPIASQTLPTLALAGP
jgi:uncharacterized Zn-binding protein involved in type VI secretion